MKKNVQNREISRIETSIRLVVLSYAPFESPFLYCVTEYDKKLRANVTIKNFYSLRDAENFMFENYVWMIIPADRMINEGTHVFVY